TRHRPVLWPAAVLAAVFVAAAIGQEPEPTDRGIFVTVANPITSEVVNGLRERIARAKGLTKIVFDFNPDGKEASTRDFGPCLDLAKELSQLPVVTVAFVHNAAARHTVLPVLACKETVMSPDAVIGPVRPDAVGPPDDVELLV